jgi:hypothetical protein
MNCCNRLLFFKKSSIGTWPGWRGVRTRRHAHLQYDTGERELYDMVADPLQLTSLLSPACGRSWPS